MEFVSPQAARDMYSRAAWTIGFALVVYFINRAEYPGPAAVLAGVIILIGLVFAALGYAMTWFTTTGQLQVREQILDSLQLQGSERVLCLSHDLGIEIAKRLKSGKVIAVGDMTTNEAARETAKQQGLADRIRFETGDPNKLSYPDANFDVVLTSRALSSLDPAQVIQELMRVLKPGGRLTLHEFGDSAHLRRSLSQSSLSSDVAVATTTLPLGLGGSIISSVRKLS